MSSFNMKNLTLFLSMLVLVSCANNKMWYKPNATQNNFSEDRYQCLQQAQQQYGGAYVNQYNGFASQGVKTNDALFTSCMNSKGWSLENKEVVQNYINTQNNQIQEKISIEKNQAKLFDEESKKICENEKYKILFKKTPCNPKDINFANLSDESKITKEEKTLLISYRSEIDDLQNRRYEYYSRVDSFPKDKQFVEFAKSEQPKIDEYNLELIKGSITWGEYNKMRKDFTEYWMKEYNKILNKN